MYSPLHSCFYGNRCMGLYIYILTGSVPCTTGSCKDYQTTTVSSASFQWLACRNTLYHQTTTVSSTSFWWLACRNTLYHQTTTVSSTSFWWFACRNTLYHQTTTVSSASFQWLACRNTLYNQTTTVSSTSFWWFACRNTFYHQTTTVSSSEETVVEKPVTKNQREEKPVTIVMATNCVILFSQRLLVLP